MCLVAIPLIAYATGNQNKQQIDPTIIENIYKEITYTAPQTPVFVWTPKYTPTMVKTQYRASYEFLDAKSFIYQHESGNRPTARNEIGCFGLGQDCNGVVENLCGIDYECQDQFFTNYMIRRYTTWENARAFWEIHRWW